MKLEGLKKLIKEEIQKVMNESYSTNANNDDLQNITANLSSLMEQMQSNTSFIEDIIKKEQHNKGANMNTPRSNDDNSKRSSNNKKKANKKNK
jgi:hypothetical protein